MDDYKRSLGTSAFAVENECREIYVLEDACATAYRRIVRRVPCRKAFGSGSVV